LPPRNRLLLLVGEKAANGVARLLDVLAGIARTRRRCLIARTAWCAADGEARERQRVFAYRANLLPVVDHLELRNRHVEGVCRAEDGGVRRTAHDASLTESGVARFTGTQDELWIGAPRRDLANALGVLGRRRCRVTVPEVVDEDGRACHVAEDDRFVGLVAEANVQPHRVPGPRGLFSRGDGVDDFGDERTGVVAAGF